MHYELEQHAVVLDVGISHSGGQPEFCTRFDWDANDPADMESVQRMTPLISAFLNFLNVGGTPGELEIITNRLADITPIEHDGSYHIVDIHETTTREVYMQNDQGQVVCIVPGVSAEELTEQQYRDRRATWEDEAEGA